MESNSQVDKFESLINQMLDLPELTTEQRHQLYKKKGDYGKAFISCIRVFGTIRDRLAERGVVATGRKNTSQKDEESLQSTD